MKKVLVGALALSVLACTGTTSQPTQTCGGEPQAETMTLSSSRQGLVEIPVTVDGDDETVQVIVENLSGGYVSIDTLLDPDGTTILDWEDWSQSHESLTDAFYANPTATVLNWPVRADDPPLSKGEWTLYASTLSDDFYYERDREVDVTILRRSCAEAKVLRVTIAYAKGLDADAEVSRATEAAVARWKEIYADHGITVEADFVSTDIRTSLTAPSTGSAAYDALYDEVGEGVVVVIGDDVGGASDLYGMAGGIPGPQVATDHSLVAIAWLVHAGANAQFSDAELELYAETMAHETGHYLGLYHPVEMGWGYWDALDDTDQCQGANACESALKTNLMFPYPVCAGGGCAQQVELSNDQQGVVRLNYGVQ